MLAPRHDVPDTRNRQNSEQRLQTGGQRAYSGSMGVGSEESAGSERGSEGGGRRRGLSEGSYGRRSERSERFGGQSQGLREESPRIPEALGRGSFVAVSARVGNDLSGYVCDADVSGLLLDVRDPSGDPGGYEFLPWSSIERVRVDMEFG